MDYAPTSATRKAASTKIVIAGGFGVGKTTFVGSVSEIVPLRTEALVTNESEGVDDLAAVPDKATTTVAMDFGRLTLAEDLVLYLFGTPGPAPVLVHVGRPVPGRHRRHRAGRHGPARRVVLAAGLLRVQGAAVHRGGQPVRRRPAATPWRRSPTPWPCPPHVPIISVDARDRESAKQALIRVTEYALQQLTESSP